MSIRSRKNRAAIQRPFDLLLGLRVAPFAMKDAALKFNLGHPVGGPTSLVVVAVEGQRLREEVLTAITGPSPGRHPRVTARAKHERLRKTNGDVSSSAIAQDRRWRIDWLGQLIVS
jgi:hypothetical protein